MRLHYEQFHERNHFSPHLRGIYLHNCLTLSLNTMADDSHKEIVVILQDTHDCKHIFFDSLSGPRSMLHRIKWFNPPLHNILEIFITSQIGYHTAIPRSLKLFQKFCSVLDSLSKFDQKFSEKMTNQFIRIICNWECDLAQ